MRVESVISGVALTLLPREFIRNFVAAARAAGRRFYEAVNLLGTRGMRGRGAGTDDGRHRWTACSSPPDVSFDRLIRKEERPLDEPSNYLPGRVYIFTGDPVACCHLPRVKNSRHGLMASERPRSNWFEGNFCPRSLFIRATVEFYR